ncbi:ARM REPEAT PROTEIN INTERACTING WITH ABF2 isoform X1 [Cucurbita moschata]|uniref:ARM REPEAT PROTEIN INTERACTING WITH ABF2 isoform X1 n=1 Tax=Cucurbita moschata TaxID=3662 RepID=A0A6J1HC81_CUCMO|nr:ARM REPEAT PROTEIN INTERACTING WITH ABF2 isoform X1 [Cucurbita moschata]
MDSGDKRIEEELSHPIVLSERVRSAVDEAESFKNECAEVGKQVDRLAQMLRTSVRFATATPTLYERPIRRVVAEVSKNLERALTLVRKCKRQSALRRVMTITSVADFRKLFNLLDASVGDMKWLLTIFECNGGGIVLSLPPIVSNDPIIAWVWSSIASIQMGQLHDRIEGTNELTSLAADNERNKNIIVEEGGIPPLLKLLKEGPSPEAQIVAIKALYTLANDPNRVRTIVQEHGIPIIVQTLANSPMVVQTQAAGLVARMAMHDPLAQEDFARENVIRPLVTLLSFETFMDEVGRQSIHSIVQINRNLEKKTLVDKTVEYNPNASSQWKSNSLCYMEGGSRGGSCRKERENERPEIKLKLKISCGEALWMLAKGSVSNSRRICETKGLLCMAKMVEKEEGELQLNCLMCIMEITAAAESNADLRRAAFKTNSPAAKAVVDQMLRVINDLDNPTLQVPAIRSIGSLARTFPARATRVIGPLVVKLESRHVNVAAEAAISLGKFVCPENFLCMEHSRTVIELNGVPLVLKILGENEKTHMCGLILLCYLALHAGSSEVVDQARVLTALEGADRTMIALHPELKDLVGKAISHLNLYHAGMGVHSKGHLGLP